MPKTYLEISKASDLKNPKERAFFRFLEFLPGILAWGTLFLVVFLSWQKPILIAVFIITFAVYWLFKIIYLSFHQMVGYRQMQKHLKIDWLEKLKKLEHKNWQNIYHLVILPMHKEGIEIVGPSFQALRHSNYPKDKMIVVLTLEERAGSGAQKTAKEIEKEFSKEFFRFLLTTHPRAIPGETAGKGSNIAWAKKQAKEKIIEPLKIPHQDIIVSCFDIDTRPYHQYFSCLTWHYLFAKNPLQSSYQPIPIYNNNIWQAPAFSRVICTSGTFWQMMQQARPEQLVTYSAHAMPFQVLEQVGYPSNMVSDDSRIFWKAYLYYDGDYQVIPLYYPVSMDAVIAENLPRTIINQYKQQRRWAWGVENIPYLLYGFLKNKKISPAEKFRHAFVVLDGFWSWAVVALLIFFLGWLPLFLGGEEFNITVFAFNLPRMTAGIMTVAMFGMIVSALISMSLLPPRPDHYSRIKTLLMLFQWLLLPITLIVFGSFPALDAQTRLFLGKRLGFWVTEKARK